MIKPRFQCVLLLSVTLVFFGLLSCNNTGGDIPFPVNEGNNAQPQVLPLQFTPPKKLNWRVTKTGTIQPAIKSLNVAALRTASYDSVDFHSFSQPALQSRFTVGSLPTVPFNLDSLPSQKLTFKTQALSPANIVKAGKPVAKSGTLLSIYDFGPNQGLPGKVIFGFLKDHNGLIWIATDNGLFRYDGEYIQTYTRFDAGVTAITSMVEDNEGKIWFTTPGSLGVLNPLKGTVAFSDEWRWPGNDLSKCIKDDNGFIWICNNIKGGILVINPAGFTYKHIKKPFLTSDLTYSLVQDMAKNIWVSTKSGGINIINNHTHTITYLQKSAGLVSDSLSAIGMDKAGNIWAGNFAKTPGAAVDAINFAQGTITHYTAAQGVIRNYLLTIVAAHDGGVWVAGLGGSMHIDPQKGVKYIDMKAGINQQQVVAVLPEADGKIYTGTTAGLNIIHHNGDIVHPLPGGFASGYVITQLEDATGNIWVGTAQGIKIIDPVKKTITFLTQKDGLANNTVQSFSEIDGKMWVTSNGGLDVIDLAHKTIEHTGRNEGLTTDTVYSLIKDRDGAVWFIGPSNGLDVINPQKTSIQHVGVAEGLSDNAILDIKQDKDGLVWVATRTRGVEVIDPKTGESKLLNSTPGLKDTCNRMLLLDEQNRMWIGTDKGVYVADTKTNTLVLLTAAEGLPNKIHSLLSYNNTVLVAAGGQVSIITPPADPKGQWKIAPLNGADILAKEVVSSWNTNIVTRKGQYVWGDSTVTFINGIQPVTYQSRMYLTGLQIMSNPRYFFNPTRIDDKDTLYQGDTFYTKKWQLTSVTSLQQQGIRWDSVTGPYNIPVNLHIPYNLNLMQFQYAPLHTGRQNNTVYRYILEGIDKQWSAVTPNSFTENYLNLPPGNYTFKVSSSEAGGRWSEPASFSFSITPPWYKTWWAYTLYVIVILSGIAIFVRYRSKKLVAENALLEEKVKQRTDALQHSLEELKLAQNQLVQSEKMASLGELTAGIAHEIQNPLNFVNNFSEVSIELVDELKEELAKANIDDSARENVQALLDDLVQNQQKINFHGKRADSIVKGMLQHSRTGSGKKEPADINALADEYLRLSYHGLRAKDKTFNAKLETNFDTSLPKISILVQEVGRVLLNLYTNAFYSVMKKKKTIGGDYQPIVSISTAKVGSQVEIRVRDNGLGIPQAVLDKIYNPFFTTKPTGEGTGLGLSLSYEIITNAHGGTITVETKEGEFAEFIIRLPLQ